MATTVAKLLHDYLYRVPCNDSVKYICGEDNDWYFDQYYANEYYLLSVFGQEIVAQVTVTVRLLKEDELPDEVIERLYEMHRLRAGEIPVDEDC